MGEGLEIISVAQMRAIDAAMAAAGTPTRVLMERAGAAVARAARARFPGRAVLVACGPGANGGDGYVAARLLAEAGVAVRLASVDPAGVLRGDAASAASAWTGAVLPLAAVRPEPDDVVIDALFGAGLSRPLEGAAAAFALACVGRDVLAVDVPSGLPGDGAAPAGPVIRAALTVSFVRKKPAHLLLPGKALCGEVLIDDLGVHDAIVATQGVNLFENAPALWPQAPVWPDAFAHKHARGRLAVVFGGWDAAPTPTFGAQRLVARAGLRIGAGWVSALAPPQAFAPLAGEPAALVVRAQPPPEGLVDAVSGHAVAFGPAAGLGDATRAAALALSGSGRPLVLDADALTAFAVDPTALLDALEPTTVLTPHAGEFVRLFPVDAVIASKVEATRAAARRAGCIVVYKGADTVIAAPDGRCAINANAPPWLAAAGTGDVLAGMIAGLMAQGVEPFAAACAGVWLHGDAGARIGPGLIADDLPDALPAVLNALAPAPLRRWEG